MPISKKVIEQINKTQYDEEFKKLMIAILTDEDKGNHRYKESYEKLVQEYVDNEAKEENSDDQNK